MKSAHVIADFHAIPKVFPYAAPSTIPRSAFANVVPRVPFLNIAPVRPAKKGGGGMKW